MTVTHYLVIKTYANGNRDEQRVTTERAAAARLMDCKRDPVVITAAAYANGEKPALRMFWK